MVWRLLSATIKITADGESGIGQTGTVRPVMQSDGFRLTALKHVY